MYQDHTAPTGTASPKPLKGIKIIELARILAGPWAGQVFADLGAEVIKIEHPEKGDDTRKWGPPFVKGADGDDLEAAYFHSCNRGKKSVCLDITSAEGQAQLHKLCQSADVLIENFKVGGLAKYHLDYESLKKINPGLIYCSITGFGQTGPDAHLPGYDFLIQGMGGIMSLTGEPDGMPQKIGVAYADLFTGLYSVIAIQSALWQRQQTGLGQHLDLALLDCQVGVLANQAMNYFTSGQVPTRMGNAHPNIVPYQVFACQDGHVIIAVGNDGQFQRLCDFLKISDWADKPEFATNAKRVENRDVLVPHLQEILHNLSQQQILKGLADHMVPGGPINEIDAVFANPQIQARDMLVQQSDPRFADGVLQGVGQPFRMNGQRPCADRAAPALGADNDEFYS